MRIQDMTANPDDVVDQNERYSEFSKAQKRWITFLVAFTSMFSPLSSFIYYPAIHTIALALGVTITLVNLSISSYMIVSGFAPAIIGNLADSVGRRPIYLSTIFIYFAANIALALQRSYPALLILRMLQSAGSSGKSYWPVPSEGSGFGECKKLAESHRHHINCLRSDIRYCDSCGARIICGSGALRVRHISMILNEANFFLQPQRCSQSWTYTRRRTG